MASRLYSTTRQLYIQVAWLLNDLSIASLGSPTVSALVSLYVTGLILLDARQTQTRVARFLPGRSHDALNRLLRLLPLSMRRLMALLISWVQRRRGDGYLCLDDMVVEKAFARRLPWAGWTDSFAKKRKVYGLHIVALLWCSHDGRWRIPTRGQIDFLVPEALAGSKGRRAARLEAQGNTLARRAEGLEGTIVDNRTMEITSLEGNDDRRFKIAVAGPGALLVAKLCKLGERGDKTNRLNNKDALDVFRLLRGIPTERMAESFHEQFAAAISASVAQTGVRLLEELFGTESALGSAMAGQAVGVLDDAVIVAASVTALAADLLTAIESAR